MRETSEPGAPRRVILETWGEIARHLGVEVRTAQRWERKLQLPVRRLDGSQAVFAYVDELHSWRTTRESGGPAQESPAAANPGHPATPRDQGPHGPWRRRFVATGVVAALVAVAGAWMWVRPRPGGEPVTLSIQGRTLVAFDALGRPSWSFDLGPTATALDVDPLRRPGLQRWWERLDSDGDGVDELIVLLDGYDGRTDQSETLLCFTLDGTLQYRFTPDLTLRFTQGAFAGPWDFFDLEPVRGSGLWVAIAHVPSWPSAIVRLDARGQSTVQFQQPGTVRLLRTVGAEGSRRVLAAGVNNEFGAASLAVLDPAKPATPPQSGPGPYACVACPPGVPDVYLLLLPSPLNRRSVLPYNGVIDLDVRDDVLVTTQEAVSVNVGWRLRHDMSVIDAAPSDSYWRWRPDGQAESPWAAPGSHQPDAPFRVWRDGRWQQVRVPFVLTGAALAP